MQFCEKIDRSKPNQCWRPWKDTTTLKAEVISLKNDIHWKDQKRDAFHLKVLWKFWH